jgi:hypothetical protein
MANEFRPLIDVLRELQTLVRKKTSGFFFIATESNNSSMILLRDGRIDEVTFSRFYNDEAVKRLSGVSAARARFQPGAVAASSGKMPLSEAAMQWLLGGFEQQDAALLQPAAKPESLMPASAASVLDASSCRSAVEKVALEHLGPIALLLCDEAFSASNDIEQILAQIASNQSTPEESRRFMDEAKAALLKR